MLCKHHFNGFKIVCDLNKDDVTIFTVSYHLLETLCSRHDIKAFTGINANAQKKTFEMKVILSPVLQMLQLVLRQGQ